MMFSGYEDAVFQYLTGRETTFSVARVLAALQQGSDVTLGLLIPIYNIQSVLSGAEYLIDFTASMPLNSETIDIRGVIYTFVTGDPANAYEIKIQGSATEMADIFAKAVMEEYSAYIYSGTEINKYFSAEASAGIVTLYARKNGRFPNNYSLTDWDGNVLSPSTPGVGRIPLLESFALDLFGSFLFTGGGVDIQGQGKSASRRYELATTAIKDHIKGSARLVDENGALVPFQTKESYKTYNVAKSYVQTMSDRRDGFYEELAERKGTE